MPLFDMLLSNVVKLKCGLSGQILGATECDNCEILLIKYFLVSLNTNE